MVVLTVQISATRWFVGCSLTDPYLARACGQLSTVVDAFVLFIRLIGRVTWHGGHRTVFGVQGLQFLSLVMDEA